ncbi:ribulokinase [Pedobacter arcticus]|uniref:ribulokinase n=1 Tax=Pedobacter arcticus TaxID=752140 RepID=UPI0002E625AF|nr:ribulokinase [Pedobacter arcticus]
MATGKYVIGLDYGTDSVRALLVDALTGKELATAVHQYPRWKQGKYCNPTKSEFRQHPLDYMEGLESTIKQVLSNVSPEIQQNIKGIAIDTTGSTPVAVDENGTPLALLPAFAENPNAMFVLWKDHSANNEADEINALAKSWEVDFTKYSGGIYSSEWFWSKILHVLRIDSEVSAKAFSWVEHCDWIPALLTGNTNPLTLKRSRCAAGHKAMWNEEFGGLPSEAFLNKLDNRLAGLRERLYQDTFTADESVGVVSNEWMAKLGLPSNVVVAVGAIDAHFGAVGAGIKENTLVKVIGTSTCDMVVANVDAYKGKLIKGICGQVDGSIHPQMLGMEAGQSAFGDLYQWFKEFLLSPLYSLGAGMLSESDLQALDDKLLPYLNKVAGELPLTKDDVVALDWINGKRTPDVDMNLKCLIADITLDTKPAHVFKALVEATAFGSKAIVERFEKEGVVINEVLALGGITKKSDFVMQTLANVLNTKIKVVTSEQACALGAAMFAATVAGIYNNVSEAQAQMTSGFDKVYTPEVDKVRTYEVLYQKYSKLAVV